MILILIHSFFNFKSIAFFIVAYIVNGAFISFFETSYVNVNVDTVKSKAVALSVELLIVILQ